MTSANSPRVRFGPFEADLDTHELWKNGLRVKLGGQPFEILALLLRKPGQMVTREELQKELWAADTFVDFNHGLNAAVNKLRETLADSAEDPKYVETLPRRGYRFVGKVETSVFAAAIADSPASAAEIETTVAPPPPPAATFAAQIKPGLPGVIAQPKGFRQRPRIAMTVGGIAIAAVILGVVLPRWFVFSQADREEAEVKAREAESSRISTLVPIRRATRQFRRTESWWHSGGTATHPAAREFSLPAANAKA